MNKQTEERIKADADSYVRGLSIANSKVHQHAGYIAGATAENSRAQVLVDALEEIIKMSNAGKILSHIDSHVAAKARKAIEIYRCCIKEAGDEKK